MEERTESTHFLEKKTSFLFFCWSCSRRLRGETGRAEDPFGRKKLAEAGPPGKRPAEAKEGKCLRLYKKHFINSLKEKKDKHLPIQ
jgi:hypothetical protein